MAARVEYYCVPIKAVPKPRMTKSDAWKHRNCVVAYWGYKDKLKEHLGENFVLSGKYSIEFLFAMPDSWSKTKKQKNIGMPHTKKPDLDNLVKGFQDAICKHDQEIWYTTSSKKYDWTDMIKIVLTINE